LHAVRDEADVSRNEPVTAGGGAYHRDEAGAWRYFWGELVPGAVDVLDERGRVVDLIAPELAGSQLLDSAATAKLVGWKVGTLASNLARGWMVPPVLVVGQCQAWTLPVLRWFVANRPFKVQDWYPDRA
jgi:hypothetical protein